MSSNFFVPRRFILARDWVRGWNRFAPPDGCATLRLSVTFFGVGILSMAIVAGCGEAAVGTGLEEGTGATDEREFDVAPAESSHVPDKAGRKRATDWPGFLGPHGTSVSNETGFADDWPQAGPRVLWKRDIGKGYGAPSVRGDRIVVHHRVAGKEIVECLATADGGSLWKFAYPSDFRDPYGYNNGPRCSPLLTADRCYTLGAEGKLACVDLESGEKIWMRDLKQDFEIPFAFFGIGASPILEDGKLIVLVGGAPDSAVVAFDPADGKVLWENVGRKTWDGVETGWNRQPRYEWSDDEMLVSYSSPIAATIHGKRHLLCLVRQGLVSLDPSDGSVRFAYFFRSNAHESVNAARPVVIGDKIFLSAAYQTGSALLQVKPDGTSCDVLWRDRRNMLAHWSTPIHVDGFLYGFSGRHENQGELRCLEVKTGRVVWKTNGFAGDLDDFRFDGEGHAIDADGKRISFPFYGRGSLMRIEDRFLVLGERGTLALLKIDPKKWSEIARTDYKPIGYPAWAAPVLSRGRLYLRDEDTLLCLELPVEKEPRTK